MIPWEQSSPIQPGKHWQEPSMGLHVPLLVQRQISPQALPYLPLGQTAKTENKKNAISQNNSELNIITDMQRLVESINIMTPNLAT